MGKKNVTEIAVFLLAMITLVPTCQSGGHEALPSSPTKDTAALIAEIEALYNNDQAIQRAHQVGESAHTRDSLYAAQDSIFRAHMPILKRIFGEHGFPTYDLVGADVSEKYWILVQHCDHFPEFQREVLAGMKEAVEAGQANPKNYAYLIDRVAMNAGEPLVYGTQLQYSSDFWVSPLPTRDSAMLDKRRAAVGLPPIETYLNEVMEMHFQMNETVYRERGLDSPNRY